MKGAASMTTEQSAADAAVSPALLFWSRLIQAGAAVVITLSLTLLLAPRLGEAIFNLVYFHQPSIRVEVPSLALGYIWFANGIMGALMAGWMISIILLARGRFLEGRLQAWNTMAIPLACWFFIDTVFSSAPSERAFNRYDLKIGFRTRSALRQKVLGRTPAQSGEGPPSGAGFCRAEAPCPMTEAMRLGTD